MSDSSYDALMQELLQMFAVEAEEHLNTLSTYLIKLEKQPDPAEKQEFVKAIFRAAHSLKGSARAVGLMDIEGVAHEAESVLNAARNEKLDFTPDVVDVLLSATDMIQGMVDGNKYESSELDDIKARLKAATDSPNGAVAASQPAPVPPPPPEPVPVQAPPPPAPAAPPPPPAADSGIDELMQELLQMFAVEAAEHLETLSTTLLKLEKKPSADEKAELVKAAFRAAHSLKGSARAVELMDIEGVAHDAESVLNAARNNKLDFTPDVVDALLAATDSIQAMVDGNKYASSELDGIKARLKAAIDNQNGAVTAPPPPEPVPVQAPPPAADSGIDALMQELLQMFAVEAEEHLETLSTTLLKLEKKPSADEKAELVKAAFRAAHSLKGSARAVELMDIEGVAHDAESVLNAARNNKLDFTPDVVDALLAATDIIQAMVDGAKKDKSELDAMRGRLRAVVGEEAPSPPPKTHQTQTAAAVPPPPPPAPPPPAPARADTVSVAPAAGDSGMDALMQELLQMFAVEAEEHIQTMSTTLLKLEKQPTGHDRQDLLNAAFRAAHSLKGSARAVELMDIEGVAHVAESVLNAARNDRLQFTPDIVDVLLSATDTIQSLVDGQNVALAHINDVKQKLQAVADQADAPTLPPQAAPPKPEPPQAAAPPPSSPQPEPPQAAAAPPAAQAPLPQPLPAPPAPQPLPPPPQKALPLSPPPMKGTQSAPVKKRPTAKPTSLSTGVPEETIRVSVEKLDDLMAQAGELIVSKISADERLRELRDLRTLFIRWDKVWSETNDLRRRVEQFSRDENAMPEWREIIEFLSSSHSFFAESVDKVRALDKSMTNDNMRMTLVTEAIQDEIRRVRMLPVDTLVPTMERVVRDVARQTGKRAQLIVRGADVELDKKVLEALKDPLVHLLRNSVDHGVEPPEDRVDNGKPEIGTVTVGVTQRGGNVHIVISDDGKGMDANAIKRSSVEKGYIQSYEAENMSDEEAFLLIFNAGLSTKQEVTEVSGRGVGMDVVKSQLESLQGRITVKSTRGQGTEFHLILPISLATIRGLIVRIGRDRYALPHHAVEKIVTIIPKEIYRVEGQSMFDLNGEPMPMIFLADVLERPRDKPREDRLLAVIVAGAERRMAFVVDEFVSEQEMVVKPLGKQLRRVRNVAGATLLGTGVPIVILNVTDLMRSAQGGVTVHRAVFVDGDEERNKLKSAPRILVVDDSITTRTLEKNILSGAGYLVETATDGVEALALLETDHFDLVVSDIEMPRIDGFELVEWIRQSQHYGSVPIILVTSLESQEHRERGLKVGADAYIVKSGFEQSVLLETIEQYI